MVRGNVRYLSVILAIAAIAVSQEKKQIKTVIDCYVETINSGDMSKLEPYLCDDFHFGDYGSDMSRLILKQLIATRSFEIKKLNNFDIERKGDTVRVFLDVDIKTKDENVSNVEDRLTLIAYGNKYRVLMIGNGVLQATVIQNPAEEMNVGINGPLYADVEFTDNPTHILLPVKVGDTTGYFILDTGSPMTIINSSYEHFFKPLKENAEFLGEAQGIAGAINAGDFLYVDSLTIGGIKLSDMRAVSMDLSHIEKGLGEKFIGLLGTDVIGKFLTTIDYRNRIVSFLRPGGEKPEFMKKPPDVVIPFEMTLHLVIVDAVLPGGARAKIALDSGAGAGLISPEVLNKVSSALVKDGRQDTLMGAGGSMKVIETKFLEGMSVGGISRDDYPMAISDISHINALSGENVHIDGLLGLNFFSDYRITLDYKNRRIELIKF